MQVIPTVTLETQPANITNHFCASPTKCRDPKLPAVGTDAFLGYRAFAQARGPGRPGARTSSRQGIALGVGTFMVSCRGENQTLEAQCARGVQAVCP